ncbi:hypothetical protein SKTS_32470 [Sulfurimicrobium lacus]|uniref:Uncharacterized protein n=1 Tax=Sulfurimicrobium lacus TaxID=2715678 RepID=A0A6F8VGS0_9PROT|nr:hypothetical protein SKTS_32470 [Sulfurimicrobium lacus]
MKHNLVRDIPALYVVGWKLDPTVEPKLTVILISMSQRRAEMDLAYTY